MLPRVARRRGRTQVTRPVRAGTLRPEAMVEHKREVEKLRQEIAQLDEQLSTALEKRARAARAIGELVRGDATALPLRDRAFIEDLVARSKGELAPGALRSIWREIQAACVGLELSARVAVLGPEGGAGHSAAREQFGDTVACEICATADDALESVARQRADFAVIPYETSADGPVQATIMALMARELRVAMVREVAPTLHLFSRTGKLTDIATIYGTAGDRALAERSLSELGSVAVVDVKSPLQACERAGREDGAGALASGSVGAGAGLEIARRSMLDETHGRVRYAIVGLRPSPRTGDDCTGLVFSLHDAPGALLDVLRQFADHGVNLSRIQSRPAEGDDWAYLFFLEVIGHATDRALVSAFEGVRRQTKLFKVLGSYPARG